MIKNFVRFCDLFDYENKSKIKAGDGLQTGKYPFYTSSNELSKYLNEYSFDKTSLIFGTGGNASIHYTNVPFSVSTDCVVAIPMVESKICAKFVFYYLSGNINLLEEGFKGAGLKHISKAYINEIQIPIPPLATQKRIAEILDAADELRRKDQELLKKYDELAHAIFIDMFGDPVKNEKGWTIKRLDEALEFPNGLVDPTHGDYKDLLHVGGDNIDSLTGQLFNLKKAKELGLKSGKFYFTPNHILYNKIRPYLNKVALPNFNGICSADMYPLLPKTGVVKEYIYFVLRSRYFLDFTEKQSRRANIPKINMTEMAAFELPIPPIEIQRDFLNKINNNSLNSTRMLICSKLSHSLFNSLIQKAFNGELVS
jgi:type I restriction enzyme S subunit